ncbi:MAG: hypothetical protein GY937_08640 [bacterium]|nr:hypothetical protein [bacterium]
MKILVLLIVFQVVWVASGNANPAYLQEELPDVVLSQRIQDKALDLGNDPVRIFEFVRNEFDYEAYYGLRKGPEQTLLAQGGNEYDLAALLVSLLRVSGTPARFVRGVIEVEGDEAGARWGGTKSRPFHLTQPEGWTLANGLRAITASGGRIRSTNVWVEAQVPMGSYRGTQDHPAKRGPTWVPLDPSFKLRDWRPDPGLGIGTDPALTFDYASYYDRVTPMLTSEVFEDQVRAHLASTSTNGAALSVQDAMRGGPIIKQEPGVIPNALPYRLSGVLPVNRAASLIDLHEMASPHPAAGTLGAPDYRYLRLLHLCTVGTTNCQDLPLSDPNKVMEVSDWSAKWEGKRLTLTFPATGASIGDLKPEGYESLVGVSGNPIVTLPTVSLDGVPIGWATSTFDLGTTLVLAVEERSPMFAGAGPPVRNTLSVHDDLAAGGVYLPSFDDWTSSPTRISEIADSLIEAGETYPLVEEPGTQEIFIDLDKDGNKGPSELYLAQDMTAQEVLTGSLLALADRWYWWVERRGVDRILALHRRIPLGAPSAGLVSSGRQVDRLFEVPFAIHPSELLIDLKGVFAISTHESTETTANSDHAFDLLSHHGSAVEHAVWEEIARVEAVSTVKGFQLTRESAGETPLFVRAFNRLSHHISPGAAMNTPNIGYATFCEIARSFWAQTQEPHKGNIQAGSCGLPWVPHSNTTTELRIMTRSQFSYNGWDGYVFVRQTKEADGSKGQSMIISPSAAGGGSPIFGSEVNIGGGEQQFPSALASVIEANQVHIPSFTHALGNGSWAGDPVSVTHGNYFESNQDILIPGPGGMDLGLVRTYSSRLDYEGVLGHGWVHSFEQHIREDPGDPGVSGDETAVWVDETAAEEPWADDGVSLTPEDWNHHTLIRNGDGSYTLTTKSRMVIQFRPADGQGIARISSLTDRNGNTIVCNYTGSVLTSVTDAADRDLEFFYDQQTGFLTEIRDWTQRKWRYTVDSAPDLIEYMDPVQVAKEELVPGSGRPWSYEYYGGLSNSYLNHNLLRFSKPEDRDQNGSGDYSMTFVYYPNDTVYSHTDSLDRTTTFSYNYFRKRTDVVHPDGGVETHFFDGYANVTRFVSPRGVVTDYTFLDPATREQTQETDALGFSSSALWDDAGNLISRTDRAGETETWTHNILGQPTSHTDKRGNTREWIYDEQGNLLTERVTLDGMLKTVREHEVDGFGNRVQTTAHLGDGRLATTRLEFDTLGVAVERTIDPYGHSIRVMNDPLGRPIAVETDRTIGIGSNARPARLTASTTYDELGRTLTVTDPSGAIQEIDYDANGLPTETRTVVPDPAQPGPVIRTDASFTYDVMDRRTQTEDVLGHATSFAYDERDRLISTTSPLGRTSLTAYDLDGNPVAVTDPSGAVSTTEYDLLARPIRSTDALGRETTTEYDEEGRPLEVRAPGNRLVFHAPLYDEMGLLLESLDAESRRSVATYDELGRRRTLKVADSTPDEATTTLLYDLLGRLVEKVDAKGHSAKVDYDLLGRVVATEDGLGRHSYFSYDEVGNLVQSQNGAGEQVHRVHDERGLVTARLDSTSGGPGFNTDTFKYDAYGRLTKSRAAVSNVERFYEYDLLDRVTSIREALAGTERFVYDEDGQLISHIQPTGVASPSIGVNYQHDERGLLSRVTDSQAGTWHFEYDAIGRLVRRDDPSGGRWTAQFNTTGFLDRVDMTIPGSSGDFAIYTDYDLLGNPGSIATAEGTTALLYDARSRITDVTYPTTETEVFRYDAVGNRTGHVARSGLDTTHVVDAADQLVRIKETATDTILEEFAHDGAGRRISHLVAGVTTTYGYDALNALRSVSASDGSYVSDLQYDAERSLYQRFETGGAAFYPSPSLEIQGVERHRIVRGAGVDSAMAEVTLTATGHIVHQIYRDGSANVARTSTTDEAGATTLDVPPARYESFGSVRSGVAALERGFASQRTEGGSGLVRMGVRHYDPATGSFLQSDPLGLDAPEMYAYASNNPYRFWDPSGLRPGSYSQSQNAPTIRAAVPPSSLGEFLGSVEHFGVSGVSEFFHARSVGFQAQREQALFEGDGSTFYGAGAAARRNSVLSFLSEPTNVALGAISLGEGLLLRSLGRAVSGGATRTGIRVNPHGVQQKISRRVSTADELDAIRNPLQTRAVKIDKWGRPSQRFVGRKAEVVRSPATGEIISVNPTSSKKVERLLRQLGLDE